ncbi:unnamed protein product [Rhizophagus irregularis]|nr:unnamed protein product [Rhizophagus irregularis]
MAGSEYSSPEIFATRSFDTVLKKILENEQPVFHSNSEEQKLRNLLLEVLYRLPQNEALKPYATELLQLLMGLLKVENEDNAVIYSSLIIFTRQSANSNNSTPSPRPTSPVSDVTTNEATPNKVLARVYTVLNIKSFVPLIIKTLGLQARPQAEAHEAAIPEANFCWSCSGNQGPCKIYRIHSCSSQRFMVATRHILSTDIRNTFINKIDILLDEKVLVGPMAYSMLADLVHHVRNKLTPTQLSKTVYIVFAQSTRSDVGCRDDKDEAREFTEFNEDNSAEQSTDYFDFEQARPIHTASPNELQQDIINEGRFLFRNLVSCLKPILIGLKQTNPPLPQPDNSNIIRRSQIKLTEKLISLESSSRIGPFSKLEKMRWSILVVHFLYRSCNFPRIFASQMGLFFDKILQNLHYYKFPQLFLATNEVISQNFAGILLRFLVDRLDKLGGQDTYTLP